MSIVSLNIFDTFQLCQSYFNSLSLIYLNLVLIQVFPMGQYQSQLGI